MEPTFRRKQNRLPLDVYRGTAAYSLTLRCAKESLPFTNPEVVRTCVDALRTASDHHGVSVLAYCFMPDHLHLLVQGADRSFVPDFVKDFKQGTGYAYRKWTSKPLWQKSYYDHVLRRDEDVSEVARYIVGNPVRANLVSQARDYLFSGSFVWGEAVVEA